MLRLLTLSTLFPDTARPNFGAFVERQTLALAARADVELQIVSPVGLPPWPLSRHPHYSARARLPIKETWKGLVLHRPRFHAWPGMNEGRAGRSLAKSVLPLLRSIHERFPFDAIQAEFFWPDGVAAMHLSRALGVPFTVRARGSDIHYWARREATKPQILEASLAAGRILAVSGALRGDMISLGMDPDKIHVCYTGVDLAMFRPGEREAAKAKLGVSGPLALSVGALIELKGHDLLLDALTRLPGLTLFIAGDGPERGRLEAKANRLELAERVRFLGNRPHDELPALMAASDLLLHASRAEGLANVWIEALASGTPVVTADVGGARELLEGSGAGRAVPRTPEAIADAARELIEARIDPATARKVAERFSWEANSAALHAHLSEISRAA